MTTFKPEYPGRIQGWAVNFCSENAWRVSATMELNDLLQEAYLTYLKVVEKYGKTAKNGPHFMRLYQTTLRNRVTDLAWDASEVYTKTKREEVAEFSLESVMGDSDNDGYLSVLIQQAPTEVKMVLNMILNAPQEFVEVTMASWRRGDNRMSNGGCTRINRALGLDPEINVMQLVRDYFS